MTEHKFIRRNRVDERAAAAIAVLAGIVAAFSGAAPTGSSGVDVALLFLGAGVVTWASASAPWWAVSGACGIGAAVALDPIVAAVGAVGFSVALVVGVRQRSTPELRAAAGGIAVNVFARSELEGFLGLSAIIGVTVCGALFVAGLMRRKSAIRRPGWIGVAVVGGLAVLAVGGVGLAASASRSDVESGARAARQALDALDDGDYEFAAQLFDDAAANFEAASGRLGGGLSAPSRLVPVVSQNVRAGADLAEVAASSLRSAAASLREVDPSTLKVNGGAIDLDAVRAVEAPLENVQAALEDLQAVTVEVRSPWLVGPIQDELDELEADLAKQEPRLENAVDAVRVAPAVLGGDGARRYLVMFTSPAEARGIGGFFGNYAEVEIDDGRISVTDFARRSELEDAVRASDVVCDDCPEEFVDLYATSKLIDGDTGTVGGRAWSNITLSPHFPYVAETAQVLYPQSGGRPIDGVILMDPYVVEALMAYTGPIEVSEFGVTVQPENAAEFIIEDQYLLAVDEDDESFDNTERIDALETLGTEVIARLLVSDLPEPVELANVFAPLVAERRLLMWTDEPAEQDLFARIRLLGDMPELSEAGGFSVSVSNVGASKIDAFLDRDVTVEVVDGDDGGAQLRATVEFTNNAPASGLPDYVIGNSLGLPDGTSRLLVVFYGPTGLDELLRDGEPVGAGSEEEAGWARHAVTIDLAPGESTMFELTFDLGLVSPDAVGPTLFDQPLASRE